MNNNSKDDAGTIALDEPSLSESDGSVWDMKTLDLDPLGALEEWMEAAEERISIIFLRYFFATIKPKCLMARAA
eukprot:13034463-Ditylum_brightwellii.AAC.1